MCDKSDLHQGILKMTLSLYNNPHIPRDAIQEIISMMINFISEAYVPFLQQNVATELQDIDNKDILSRVKLTLQGNKYSLQEFSSEHLRFKMYEYYCSYIPPQSYKIAEDVTFVGNVIKKKTPIYATITPTTNLLRCILKIPGLLDEIINYIKLLKEEKIVISNIMQGKLWKRKYEYLQDKIVLPLFMYYDDFEHDNAMGSHAGEQQLGGIYMALPFLPPHLVANLGNIFVLSICYSKHRKTLGYRVIFKKIIEEINSLSIDGIVLDIDGRELKIYFRCVLIIGDNLGLNSAFGMVESFNALRYCRICRATCVECQTMTTEDPKLLRTKENYIEDVQKNCISTGIKEECIFNDIVDFHVVDNKCVDLMHDVCEGVMYYTLSKILTCLIEDDKLFTLETLNQKIQNFNYGNIDSSNKPRLIIKDFSKKTKGDIIRNKIKLKQSAAEMLCLCRYLSIIIGDLIPENNRYWKLYLVLRKIIGITTAPRFVLADIAELRFLINKHNERYIKLFGLLKPQMHFMIHMPQIMLENGPLVHFWCMLNEKKNKEIKEFASNTHSNENLPLTVSIRSQLQVCYLKETYQNISKVILINIINDTDTKINNFFPLIKGAPTVSYIQLHGNKFYNDAIIVIEINDDGPVFGKIKKIYQAFESIYVLVNEITVIYFKNHYYAYKVNVEQETVILDVNLLPKIEPCLIAQVLEDTYVITRYDV